MSAIIRTCLESFPEEYHCHFRNKFVLPIIGSVPVHAFTFIKNETKIMWGDLMSCEDGVYNIVFKYREITGLIVARFIDINGALEVLTLISSNEEKNVMEFIEEILEYVHNCDEIARSLIKNDSAWEKTILKKDQKQILENTINNFIQSRDLYTKELEIAYKTGILLTGPPGNGKTRAIRSICSKYGLSMNSIDSFVNPVGKICLPVPTEEPSRQGEENKHKLKLFYNRVNVLNDWSYYYYGKYHTDSSPSVVVVEDLDKQVFNKNNEDTPRFRLSDFLNAIDGIDVVDGLIMIATTNNLQDLPMSMLMRPGRFDNIMIIENPDIEQFDRYFESRKLSLNNYPVSAELFEMGLSMAFAEQFMILAKFKEKSNNIPYSTSKYILGNIRNHKEGVDQFLRNAGYKVSEFGF